MSTGMAAAGAGHWFIWGILGITGLIALISIAGWMRREKEKTNAYVASGGSNTVTTNTRVASPKVESDPQTYYAARKSTQESGWGFWPWAFISAIVLGALAWLIWNSSISSGTESIKWILYSLLGIGGLLSIAGISQMTRRHPLVDEKRGRGRGLGFITLASGLMLALASLFVWAPKFAFFNGLQDKISQYKNSTDTLNTENVRLTGLLKNSSGNTDEITRLNGVVERLNGDNSIMKGENSRLKGLLANNRTDADEVTRLNGIIARLNKDKTTMGSENTRLKGLLSSNRTDGDEITRLNGIIARLNKDKTAVGSENTRLKGLLSSNRTDGDEITRLNGIIARLNKDNNDATTENTRIKGLLGNYRNDSEVQSAKIASLEDELAKLRNRPAVAAPVVSSSSTSPLYLINQHNQNNANLRLATNDYKITKMRRSNLVRGKNGHYYKVLIKNPANGKGYQFASASYHEVVPETTFKASLDKAIADIKKSFDGRRNYQLYVQGNASAGKYLGKTVPGYEYKDIKVLENFRGRYDNDLEDYVYGPMIRNKDLPNLRGAYLQDLITKNYKVTPPIILNGEVSKSKKASEQAVALILYVED